MRVLLFVALSGVASVLFAAESPYLLTAKEWAVPRSGAALLSMPPVRAAMRELDSAPQAHLRVRYPGGDEGTLWAHELQGWLVALGLASTRIELVPGSRRADALGLEVVRAAPPAPTRP